MPTRCITRLASAFLFILVSQARLAAQNPTTPPAIQSQAYPRINLAQCYEVDPLWPEKPPEYEWKAVSGIAVDGKDRVWILTRSTPPVQVYTAEGRFLRAWGDHDVKTAHHIEIDREENVWISDIGDHVVRKFSPGGEVLLTLGTPGEPGADEKHLNKPTDMAITPGGDVFVSDGYGNNRVVHFDAHGKFVGQWGSLGTAASQLSLPHAIAIDSGGRLYVADRNNVRVQVYDQRGTLLDSWQNLIVPWGLWVAPAQDGVTDEIWVCGSSPMPWRDDPDYPGAPLGCPPKDQVLMRFDIHGKLLQLWTIPKGADGREQPGEVNWIHALALDSQGNVYVGDIIGKRAQKFSVRLPQGAESGP